MMNCPIAFCINCNEKKEYEIKVCRREIKVRGVVFSYVHQTAYCTACNKEVYVPELNDANAQARKDGYRKAAGLKNNLEIIEKDLNLHKRDKRDLLNIYVEERLNKSLKSYYDSIQKAYEYVKYRNELKTAKKLNRM